VIDEEELGWTVARRKNDKEKASKSEEPKVAFGRNRARVFGHFFLFHAIPLAGAIALIVINVQGWFLGVIGGSWISSLQFVAKVHEMLMQASIGVVTLAYVQYLLIHERSIPFGALFSYYQINQLSYLWSSEFYAAVTTPSFHGFLRTGFLLFIPFSMLLATGVGPSSAIAMQPRILNFTIPDQLFAFDVNSSSFYPDSFLTPVYGLNQSSITSMSHVP
jgi:hypothetical protein